MKVSELMTPNPEFCTLDDTIVDCARIMAQKDVGIVPICESRDTRRVIGLVTDRDIVVRCIAEGRDVNTCRLDDIMTQANLVTAREDEDVEAIESKMKDRQVRRVLVVDEYNALAGVVATADLARSVDQQAVGETLESISEPAIDPTPTK